MIVAADGVKYQTAVPVLIIGAGAGGLTAALAAADAGAEALVLERDARPGGSTALSSGMIPAAATRWQRGAGIDDSPALLAADIQRKAGGGADPAIVDAVCAAAAPTLEWLADRHGIAFALVQGFLYPGHSVARMHAPYARSGRALHDGLYGAAERAGVGVLRDARVDALYADDATVRGARIVRPDGSVERVGCERLILACNGYGGNPERVRRHLPEMADALYFGHAGNQGDALVWGEALGAATRDLGAYQGHGSVAVPQQILISWALMMEGGVQVNGRGERFSNEHAGYSEQAVAVLAQPDGIAWNLYDERLHRLGLEFDDYRRAVALGAPRRAETLDELARLTGLPADALAEAVADTGRDERDRFGRELGATPALAAPYYAVRVTGALFHTQGGLRVDGDARVLTAGGAPLPNLYAVGGAACGVSGASGAGYLSGNGLLSAVALGRLAGQHAASASPAG